VLKDISFYDGIYFLWKIEPKTIWYTTKMATIYKYKKTPT
jgi:hypothetical protein